MWSAQRSASVQWVENGEYPRPNLKLEVLEPSSARYAILRTTSQCCIVILHMYVIRYPAPARGRSRSCFSPFVIRASSVTVAAKTQGRRLILAGCAIGQRTRAEFFPLEEVC